MFGAVLVCMSLFGFQSFSAEVSGRCWTYNAVIKPQREEPLLVHVEILFVKAQAHVALGVVRTPWQTEVQKLYEVSGAFDLSPTTPFLVGYACWPRIMFHLLPVLEDPFPRFLPLLLEFPFSLEWSDLQEAEISYFAKGSVARDGPRTRMGVTVRFGSLTVAETPLGRLRLMPMQAEALTFHQHTYVFTSWCIAEEECPCAWMELAPVKVEGVVREVGVVRTEFAWELAAFAELNAEELVMRIDRALTEMAQTRRLESEKMRNELRTLGIELP